MSATESLAEFFLYDPSVAGVKGLVVVGDRLLVYRRDQNAPEYPHFLDLPGGAAEPGETPFETFQREVTEEFSLHLVKEHIVDAEKRYKKDGSGKAVYFPVAKLLAAHEEKIKLGDEGTEFLLLTLSDFLTRSDVWPYFQQRVAEYIRQKGSRLLTNK